MNPSLLPSLRSRLLRRASDTRGRRAALGVVALCLLASLGCPPAGPCTAAEDPAYVAFGEPTLSGHVVFDASHRQFHCIGRSYRGTADTLRALGLEVDAGDLDTAADVRVVLPPRDPIGPAEAAALAAWVEAGGRLLVVADHAPYPANLAPLANALGFTFGADVVAPAGCAGDVSGDCGRYTFRDSGVVTYSGVAVYGGTPFLIFGDDAEVAGASAAGLAQGALAQLGAGRVIVLGEARVLSASSHGGIQVEANRDLLVAIFTWLLEPAEEPKAP